MVKVKLCDWGKFSGLHFIQTATLAADKEAAEAELKALASAQ